MTHRNISMSRHALRLQTDGVRGAPRAEVGDRRGRSRRTRAVIILAFVLCGFSLLIGQLVWLALSGQGVRQVSMTRPIATAFARPDIVDRRGRLLATDVSLPSLFADPSRVIDRNVVVEKLRTILPQFNEEKVHRGLREKGRRFMWVRRGLSPRLAQAVHNAGLPGLSFRSELQRAYPMGGLGGFVVGAVDVDNRGVSGIERYLDERKLVEPVHGVAGANGLPVRLSLDLGAQHALRDELSQALKHYGARGATGVVLDVHSGEIIAASTVPGVKSGRLKGRNDEGARDTLTQGAFELGSVFKLFSVATALDRGIVRPNSRVDVSRPLIENGYVIKDAYASLGTLSISDIIVRSSNVGAGVVALEAGTDAQQAFLKRAGLLDKLTTEAGPIEAPRAPKTWGRLETITVSYGHGIAVSPLQFAAASAALVNGGTRIVPSFVRDGVMDQVRGHKAASVEPGEDAGTPARVMSAQTSAWIRDMMRKNVTDPHGTGRRADVPGYRVGGKTGTAELPVRGGYSEKAVISSFLAAFPMDAPRYVVLVSLFEPRPTVASGQKISASHNAAPVAGRVISRVGPLLGVRAIFDKKI